VTKAPSFDPNWKKVSFEIIPSDLSELGDLKTVLPSGTYISIAALPKGTLSQLVTATIGVRKLGFNPIPHITARSIVSRQVLEQAIGEVSNMAHLTHALILGGDRVEPAGPFNNALDLIHTGTFERHGVTNIAFGCYPEGHPFVSDAELNVALRTKVAAATKRGLKVSLVTQMCFDAKPIISYVKNLREIGIDCPVHIGVAGPASRAILLKYAFICGVGPSIRLLKNKSEFAKGLIANGSPDALLAELRQYEKQTPCLGIDRVHFFTFGSVKNSVLYATT
jgi:methylenetetrahydrofolate reductase (NADPH)